ncbi:MAG TPA: CheR family methyltransferase, partial [Aquabacterium sp.]|nr:CheR family methyltransferase [Aquabacterium sp.]
MDTLRDDTFRRITGLMHEVVGLSFPDSKKPLITSRLAGRIQRLGLNGFEEYFELIASEDEQEFQVAVDLLTTNETYFFREPAHFAFLERELQQTKPKHLSVWSAASSYGDEAYTV